MQEFFDHLADDCSGIDFVQSLFQPCAAMQESNDTMIAAALTYAVQTHPNIKSKMQSLLADFMERFSAQLLKLYLKAEKQDIEDVSAGGERTVGALN